MDLTCSQCNHTFISNKPRTICFLCRPNPKLGPPAPIVAQYIAGASVASLATKYGVSVDVVCYYIQNYGTPRPCGERSPSYHPPVSLDLDWLDGWLLSDGSLALNVDIQCKNACAAFSSKYVAYADYVVQNLRRMGLLVTAEPREQPIVREGCHPHSIFHVASHAHPFLTLQHTRWYPTGSKRVPTDVRLTPTALREWYLGDGTFYKSNGCPALVMGGVLESEVDLLRSKLMDLFQSTDISKHRQERKTLVSKYHPHGRAPSVCWSLYFLQTLAPRFFSYIGPCTLSCYAYKWPDPQRSISHA